MNETAGWNIWGMSFDKIRQFTVAKADEQQAFAILRRAHPDVEIVSRHTMDVSTIRTLGIPEGRGVEWVPLDPKDPFTHIGGVPIGQPIKG